VAYSVDAPAAAPVFSLRSGTYSGAQQVSISEATSGAAVYYTLDGTTPTASSTPYTETAINIVVSETLRAVALAPGFARSPVRTANYTIQ
jgi:hypothetical protein